MKWDTLYRAALEMPVSRAADLVKAQCPDWQDPRDPVLFLTNAPLPDPAATEYQLVYSTPGRPWLVDDEVFYLYAPGTIPQGLLGVASDAVSHQARKPICQWPAALH